MSPGRFHSTLLARTGLAALVSLSSCYSISEAQQTGVPYQNTQPVRVATVAPSFSNVQQEQPVDSLQAVHMISELSDKYGVVQLQEARETLNQDLFGAEQFEDKYAKKMTEKMRTTVLRNNHLEPAIERLQALRHYIMRGVRNAKGTYQHSNLLVAYAMLAVESNGFIDSKSYKYKENVSDRLESRGNYDVVGICQFLDVTAKEEIIKREPIKREYLKDGVYKVDFRYAPEESIDSCIRLFEKLRSSGKNQNARASYLHALVGYNAGPAYQEYVLGKDLILFSQMRTFFVDNDIQETPTHLLKVAAYAKIFSLASLPESEKTSRAEDLLVALDRVDVIKGATSDGQKFDLIRSFVRKNKHVDWGSNQKSFNDLASLQLRWPVHGPSWFTDISPFSKEVSPGTEWTDFPTDVSTFNQQYQSLLKTPTGECKSSLIPNSTRSIITVTTPPENQNTQYLRNLFKRRDFSISGPCNLE